MHYEFVSGSKNIEDIKLFLNEIVEITNKNNCTIQAINADKIAGEKHLKLAVKKAIKAFEQKTNSAKDLGIEIMRYASGKRQIEEALSMGITLGQNNIVFVIIGEKNNLIECKYCLEKIILIKDLIPYTNKKKDSITTQFEINSIELETVGEDMIPLLVLERVALVDILK